MMMSFMAIVDEQWVLNQLELTSWSGASSGTSSASGSSSSTSSSSSLIGQSSLSVKSNPPEDGHKIIVHRIIPFLTDMFEVKEARSDNGISMDSPCSK